MLFAAMRRGAVGSRGFWLWAALAAVSGCVRRGAVRPAYRAHPGQAEARFAYYGDDRGLQVWTSGAAVEQPVSQDTALLAQVWVDRIVIHRPTTVTEDTGDQATGHVHSDGIDAVSNASVNVLGGDDTAETRVEGTLGVHHRTTSQRQLPIDLHTLLRVSSEPDYMSLSGRIRLDAEFLQRNLTLSSFAGYGYDVSSPLQKPPGEIEAWPAANQRWNAGVSLTQLLGERLQLSGGLSLSHQFGTLSNPYRRALVRTSLFPENLPSKRFRLIASLVLTAYLGWESALHLRPAAYVDDWGIWAFVPELAWVKEVGSRLLVSLKYRYYAQSSAEFYAVRYRDVESYLTGDLRLGRIRNHVPGFTFSWAVLGEADDFGSLGVGVGYSLSWLDYRDLGDHVVAHIASASLSGAY